MTLNYFAHAIPGQDEAAAEAFEGLLKARDAHVTRTRAGIAGSGNE